MTFATASKIINRALNITYGGAALASLLSLPKGSYNVDPSGRLETMMFIVNTCVSPLLLAASCWRQEGARTSSTDQALNASSSASRGIRSFGYIFFRMGCWYVVKEVVNSSNPDDNATEIAVGSVVTIVTIVAVDRLARIIENAVIQAQTAATQAQAEANQAQIAVHLLALVEVHVQAAIDQTEIANRALIQAKTATNQAEAADRALVQVQVVARGLIEGRHAAQNVIQSPQTSQVQNALALVQTAVQQAESAAAQAQLIIDVRYSDDAVSIGSDAEV